MGKIIWLASYPKSGNTWVRTFLANLFSGSSEPYDINALDRFCPSLTSRAAFDAVAGRPTIDMSPVEVLGLRESVQRTICDGIPESAFIKTHSQFGARLSTTLISPEHTAGAIYIVRNPLDVAVSAASHFGIDLDEMVQRMADPNFATAPNDKHVADYIGAWSGHVMSWTMPEHPKIHVVRYEDIHARPTAAFGKLLDFLGLKASSEQLDTAIRFSGFAILSTQERTDGFKERPAHAPAFFRHGQPGDGARRLSQAQVAAMVAAHGAQMRRFGYLP